MRGSTRGRASRASVVAALLVAGGWGLLVGGGRAMAASEPLNTELQALSHTLFPLILDVAGDVAVAVSGETGLVIYLWDDVQRLWIGYSLILSAPVTRDFEGDALVTDGQRVAWVEKAGETRSLRGAELTDIAGSVPILADVQGVRDLALEAGLLVAATDDGLVRTFEWNGSGWTSSGLLPMPVGTYAVSVATDGVIAAVGLPFQGDDGAVAVFRRQFGGWVEVDTHEPDFELQSGASFGRTIAFGGGCLLVGAPLYNRGFLPPLRLDAGAVFSYAVVGDEIESRGALVPGVTLPANARYGWSLDVDTDSAVVGSPGFQADGAVAQGRVHIFARTRSSCGAGIGFGEIFLARTAALVDPSASGVLGVAVGQAADSVLAIDATTAKAYSFLRGAIFVDDLETGDTSRWQ